LRRLKNGSRKNFENYGQQAVLIEPLPRPGPKRGDTKADIRGPTEFLPAVTCQEMFESSPVRGELASYSLLLIIWFQERFALPIDADVVVQIQKADWETLAFNYFIRGVSIEQSWGVEKALAATEFRKRPVGR
jgi:hypothetical protein